MDDHLFNLWREEKVTVEDILAKAHDPDALARRIADGSALQMMQTALSIDPERSRWRSNRRRSSSASHVSLQITRFV